MFDYCLLIPSAAKTFFSNGNKITVLDGAHKYSKYEGVILTICGKDDEDHVLQLGFALVPQKINSIGRKCSMQFSIIYVSIA
jgi:hypothetical protein